MKKTIILTLILILLVTNTLALTTRASEELKSKVLAVSRDKEAFKSLLSELNKEGLDLTDEEYIKELIIIRASIFNINLKDYPNIIGLYQGEKLNIEQEKYPNIDFEKKQKIDEKKLIWIIIIIAIIAFLILLFIKLRKKEEYNF